MRDEQRAFFESHLRATTNKHGRQYSERSVGAYRDAVISLHKYLTGIDFPGGFEAVTVETLNAYLRAFTRGVSPSPPVLPDDLIAALLEVDHRDRLRMPTRPRDHPARADDPTPRRERRLHEPDWPGSPD